MDRAKNLEWAAVSSLFLKCERFWIGIFMHLHQQGVIKLRKRVTLMVVTVSAIFGISWGTSSVVYVLKNFNSHNNIGNVAITNTMGLVNSAANPFVYALLNRQFREKVKEMMFCAFCSTNEVHATRKTESIELKSGINHSTNEEGLLSYEWRWFRVFLWPEI